MHPWHSTEISQGGNKKGDDGDKKPLGSGDAQTNTLLLYTYNKLQITLPLTLKKNSSFCSFLRLLSHTHKHPSPLQNMGKRLQNVQVNFSLTHAFLRSLVSSRISRLFWSRRRTTEETNEQASTPLPPHTYSHTDT